MAQRDYVGRGRTNTRRKKTNSRKKRTSSGISKTMIALAVAVLITFIGGLYFIAHNKTEEAVILPSHGNHTSNGLPPKPEERWRYIKELENRQIGVQTPTEPTAGGEVQTPAQLTDEQRQLLEQMQADMRQQPTHLNEVPYNDQVKTSAANHARSQQNQPSFQTAPAPRQTLGGTTPVQPRQVFTAPVEQQQPRQAPAAQPVQQPPRQAPAAQPVQQQPRQAPAAQPVQQQPRQAPVTAIEPAPQPKAEARAEPKAETKTDKEPKEKSQRWLIQCGSFKTMDQAESIRAQLAFGGVESRITTSGGWNRVMLGPYPTRAGADKSLQNLRASGVSNCIPIASGG
ncbi:cell division protein FtsN [Acerihabitans arboris]|uniref:Cell division protein FtsN n=1 Tax=Acerihabitans arboris TaxID=2691583 RepID=A0A845SQK1_9GAMM|nr:cell division protein FtsN [Acerihabitans arboris]NDL64868.1 cell division protein FtsN [Acerihabitans arboris]